MHLPWTVFILTVATQVKLTPDDITVNTIRECHRRNRLLRFGPEIRTESENMPQKN